ncbi:hypothetical protein AGDE_15019 [Angomonas deanei]|uniref:Uncharacterized protein n=1 Tax=Angomonas deanei TaxID=59799 RepID=A0A7G2CGD5_9TRYP|nr:hypothetical protein AGDE_15019 [Angomonas deanei]CAD2217252.1 hypothetical protein, conserved [Angomonas deanei]|eukprot:EPY19818.1 hypothetical protein AGDE_15019 [Angomonas deanei]
MTVVGPSFFCLFRIYTYMSIFTVLAYCSLEQSGDHGRHDGDTERDEGGTGPLCCVTFLFAFSINNLVCVALAAGADIVSRATRALVTDNGGFTLRGGQNAVTIDEIVVAVSLTLDTLTRFVALCAVGLVVVIAHRLRLTAAVVLLDAFSINNMVCVGLAAAAHVCGRAFLALSTDDGGIACNALAILDGEGHSLQTLSAEHAVHFSPATAVSHVVHLPSSVGKGHSLQTLSAEHAVHFSPTTAVSHVMHFSSLMGKGHSLQTLSAEHVVHFSPTTAVSHVMHLPSLMG